jgi:predicted AAA+ superfamily ATPase
LFIKGARQIGKTTVIRNFIKSKYKNIIEINFTEAKKYKKAFAESLIVDDIIKALSALNPNFKFEANNTCFFFVEVQECPLARTAVKFICLDGRFDVIYTSSLLGATYKNDGSSVPVGFEREIMMYPLDFEEFLMSLNYSEENLKYFHEIAEKIRLNNFDFLNCKNSINYILHKEMLNHFNEYVVVGGMPDTVLDFTITHDYNSVFQIQNEIILSYKEDILKYAPKNAKDKVEKTFNLLPSQLAKQNSKLVFSQIVGKKTNFGNFRAPLK